MFVWGNDEKDGETIGHDQGPVLYSEVNHVGNITLCSFQINIHIFQFRAVKGGNNNPHSAKNEKQVVSSDVV